MVPLAGLEPALLAEPDFESGVSTNSTIEAWKRGYTGGGVAVNGEMAVAARWPSGYGAADGLGMIHAARALRLDDGLGGAQIR